MRIYLARHGQPTDNTDDPDRELTPEGEATVSALAEWMLRKNEIPAFLYASPAVRTQQTAEILRDAFGLDKYLVDTSIAPRMSINGLIQKLAADDLIMRPMIVTHGECIDVGLKALSIDGTGDDKPKNQVMPTAMGELRIIRVKRGDTTSWREHRRVLPSDLGFGDYYSTNGPLGYNVGKIKT